MMLTPEVCSGSSRGLEGLNSPWALVMLSAFLDAILVVLGMVLLLDWLNREGCMA